MSRLHQREDILTITKRLRIGRLAEVQSVNNDGSVTSSNLSQLVAGSGVLSGTGTVYESSVIKVGGVITTTLLLDLTGLSSSAVGDIIGVAAAANCHFGKIDGTESGTIIGGKMKCLEVPAGGEPDIDIYSATESTGTEATAITALDETLVLDAAGDWTLGLEKIMTGFPAANEHLYLVGSGAGTTAVYTAGKFLIELYGH